MFQLPWRLINQGLQWWCWIMCDYLCPIWWIPKVWTAWNFGIWLLLHWWETGVFYTKGRKSRSHNNMGLHLSLVSNGPLFDDTFLPFQSTTTLMIYIICSCQYFELFYIINLQVVVALFIVLWQNIKLGASFQTRCPYRVCIFTHSVLVFPLWFLLS
jgi:hypothetical protein